MIKEEKLIQILNQNPDRKLIFMYPSEGSDYSYTMGKISKILVDEYVTIDERVWIRGWDEDELHDNIGDNIADELFGDFMTLTKEQEAEVNRKAEEHIAALGWKKAIIVYISY